MKALSIAGGLWVGLALSTPAMAHDAASANAACRRVFEEVAPACAEVAAAEVALNAIEKKQHQLEKDVEDATKTPDEQQAAKKLLDEIPAQLAAAEQRKLELMDTPLEELPGFCGSWDAKTPLDCSALATRLGAFDAPSSPNAFDKGSIDSLTNASKAADGQHPETVQALLRAAASDRRTANNKSGSGAQLDPVESMQPITLAGGALTLSGSRSGSKGVGTISVNPLAIAMPTDVRAGRFADLSVSAPFDLAGSSGSKDPYVSVRLRVNITGPFDAAELQQHVDAWLSAAGVYADDLEKVFLNAKDVKACAAYVAVNHRAGINACAQDVSSSGVKQAREEAFAAMVRARRAADRRYVGADVRFDTGDPTGPNIGHDLGDHALGGIAAGTRIPAGNLWDWELRARAGLDVFRSREPADDDKKAVGSVDWGGALIFSGRLQETAKQRLAFGVGAEGRHAWKDDENAKRAPTNYVILNLMAVVPALTGGDLGLAMGIPLWELREVRGVMVNFSTDLGLLDHSL